MLKKKINISEEKDNDIRAKLESSVDEYTKSSGKKNTYKKSNLTKKEKPAAVPHSKAKDRHTRRVITGAIIFVLAVIGIGSIFSNTFMFGKKIFDNTGEKNKYNTLLSTLVMYDPLPFETPEQADQRILLASSLWAAVMNEDMAKYEKDEFSQTYLPAVDVDKYFAKIFGTQVKLQHTSFEDQGAEFTFNEEKQAYVIPTTGFPSGFIPQVKKIKTTLNEKIVTVGYLSPSSSWSDTSVGNISKYVDYIFQKQDKNYCLVAIRESATKVEAKVASSEKTAR